MKVAKMIRANSVSATRPTKWPFIRKSMPRSLNNSVLISPWRTEGTAARKRSMLSAATWQGAGQLLSNASAQDFRAVSASTSRKNAKRSSLVCPEFEDRFRVGSAVLKVESGDVDMHPEK